MKELGRHVAMVNGLDEYFLDGRPEGKYGCTFLFVFIFVEIALFRTRGAQREQDPNAPKDRH